MVLGGSAVEKYVISTPGAAQRHRNQIREISVERTTHLQRVALSYVGSEILTNIMLRSIEVPGAIFK